MVKTKTQKRHLGSVAAGLLLLSTVFSGVTIAAIPAGATTPVVSNCNDAGPGSLRQAVLDAKSGKTIVFSTSCTLIALTSGQIRIRNSLTIQGPGLGALAVSGSNQSRVFQFRPGQRSRCPD